MNYNTSEKANIMEPSLFPEMFDHLFRRKYFFGFSIGHMTFTGKSQATILSQPAEMESNKASDAWEEIQKI